MSCVKDKLNVDSSIRARALIESGDIDTAWLELSEKEDVSSSQNLKNYCALCLGDGEYFNKNKHHIRDEMDADFYKLIKGKRVAVVGPAPTGEINGHEIDGYDIVIRFSYLGNSTLPSTDEFGSRTDVSYYGSTFLKRKFHSVNEKALPNIEYAVYKKFAVKSWECVGINKYRKMLPFDEMFYKGRTTMPAALFDILHYEPAKVKLFHSNFYLSRMIYADGHAGRPDNSKVFNNNLKAIRNVAYQHDHLGQLIFVRNLRDKGWIEVDEACGAVLDLSDEMYMHMMEKTYT